MCGTDPFLAVLSVAAPNASSWNQTYAYDDAGRLTDIVSPAGAFEYQYDAEKHQQVALLALPNGSAITNEYDSSARLLSTILNDNSGAHLNVHSYNYNQGNQRTQQVFTAGNYNTYTYDGAGQLRTSVSYEANGSDRLHDRFLYTYDAAGNLATKRYPSVTTGRITYQYNSLNQITNSYMGFNSIGGFLASLTVAGSTTSPATNVTVNALAADIYGDNTYSRIDFTPTNGNNTYTVIAKDSFGRSDTNSVTVNVSLTNNFAYDLNGNLLSDGRRGFDYDDENQLIRVTVTNGWKSEFSYDGKMRRRIRKEYTWNGSSWLQTNEVRYVYDGNLVIQERDANNLPQVAYTRGRDLSGSLEGAGGIGGLLARTENPKLLAPSSQLPASSYYHADGSGNITCLVSGNQTVVARYLYEPFGSMVAMSGSMADVNLYRFSSKELHANSGLAYYLYRYYEPSLQRWVNRDPIQERGGINLYVFIANDSINDTDINGLASAGSATIALEPVLNFFQTERKA